MHAALVPQRSVPPLLAALLILAGLLPASGATPAPVQERAALVAAIDSIARDAVTRGAAGLSLAVVRGFDTLLIKGYGYVDLEFDVPTPDGAIYEIGSVTKQFTAAAILLLAEQGKLSLDDDLTKHLPDFPTHGHPLPLRRLLDHTSGIKGYTEMPAFAALAPRRLPRDTLVALIAAEPYDFVPGQALVYNNSAYFLLGLVIEKVSGKPYADFVRERLFVPAGMAASRYCSSNAVVKQRAHGYEGSPGSLVRAGPMDHTWPFAAGSLCSTAGDLVAWALALHGGRILSDRAYGELVTPDTLSDGTRVRYAKGLVVDSIGGHRAIHHGGGIPGFLSHLAWFRDTRTVIAVLINTAGPVGPESITEAIAARILGEAPVAPDEEFRGDPVPLVGTYRGVGRGRPLVVTVAQAGDGVASGLTVQVGGGGTGPARPLAWAGGDTFQAGRQRFTFLRDGLRVTGLRADLTSVVSRLERQ